ncbi:MAG: hypothetical protein ACM3H7_04395, partial [Acidobacteriaceae bacterium]
APESFYMVKACAGPGNCTITQATAPFDVFLGTKVSYTNYNFGPDASGNVRMTAAITLTSTNPEDTLSGIVSWVYHNGDFTGHISLQSGTGIFEGMHAEGEIGLTAWPSTFYFSGNYLVAP